MGTIANFLPESTLTSRRDGRLDVDFLHGKVTGRFVTHQRGDLGHDLAEILDARVFVPENGELVLKQRMIQNVNMFHIKCPPRFV